MVEHAVRSALVPGNATQQRLCTTMGPKFYYVLIYPAPLAAVRGFVPHVVWHRDFDAKALLPMNARMMNIQERYLALQSIPKILELAGSMSR